MRRYLKDIFVARSFCKLCGGGNSTSNLLAAEIANGEARATIPIQALADREADWL